MFGMRTFSVDTRSQEQIFLAFLVPDVLTYYQYPTTTILFEKQQNEWLVPQIVTKLIEAGQDECRNTLEKEHEFTNTDMQKQI